MYMILNPLISKTCIECKTDFKIISINILKLFLCFRLWSCKNYIFFINKNINTGLFKKIFSPEVRGTELQENIFDIYNRIFLFWFILVWEY